MGWPHLIQARPFSCQPQVGKLNAIPKDMCVFPSLGELDSEAAFGLGCWHLKLTWHSKGKQGGPLQDRAAEASGLPQPLRKQTPDSSVLNLPCRNYAEDSVEEESDAGEEETDEEDDDEGEEEEEEDYEVAGLKRTYFFSPPQVGKPSAGGE